MGFGRRVGGRRGDELGVVEEEEEVAVGDHSSKRWVHGMMEGGIGNWVGGDNGLVGKNLSFIVFWKTNSVGLHHYQNDKL